MSYECESKAGKGQEKADKVERKNFGDTRRLRCRRGDGVRGARCLHIAERGHKRRRVPAEAAAATAGRVQRSVTFTLKHA